jgi:hypothetical protein
MYKQNSMARPRIYKNEMDEIFPIRMTKEFKDEFKLFCDKNGYSMSKRIRLIMKEDMTSK